MDQLKYNPTVQDYITEKNWLAILLNDKNIKHIKLHGMYQIGDYVIKNLNKQMEQEGVVFEGLDGVSTITFYGDGQYEFNNGSDVLVQKINNELTMDLGNYHYQISLTTTKNKEPIPLVKVIFDEYTLHFKPVLWYMACYIYRNDTGALIMKNSPHSLRLPSYQLNFKVPSMESKVIVGKADDTDKIKLRKHSRIPFKVVPRVFFSNGPELRFVQKRPNFDWKNFIRVNAKRESDNLIYPGGKNKDIYFELIFRKEYGNNEAYSIRSADFDVDYIFEGNEYNSDTIVYEIKDRKKEYRYVIKNITPTMLANDPNFILSNFYKLFEISRPTRRKM
jgi:hypothetical protein